MTTHRSLFFAVMVVMIIHPLSAQWVQTNGPYGGFVYALTASGGDLFAGLSAAGVFRSTDNGASWTASNVGMEGSDTYCLVSVGTDLYAGGTDAVFRSTDNGTSWIIMNTGLTGSFFRALAVTDTNIFAGSTHGVFLSTDDGGNWTQVNTGLTNTSIQAITVSGGNIFAGTSGGGVFRSTDNGTTWTEANSGLPTVAHVSAFAVNDTNIFAGTHGGVYRSTNNGVTWTLINTGLSNTYITSLAVNGTTLIAGTGDGPPSNKGGVFQSTDNGASWISSGLTNEFIYSLAASSGGMGGKHFLAGTAGAGVFRSSDTSGIWTQVNSGLSGTYILTLGVSGTSIFAANYPAGLFRSTDDGTSWTDVNAGFLNTRVRVFAVRDTTIFAATDSGIFRSTSNGTSWTRVAELDKITSLAIIDTNLFAGSSGGGVYLSTDDGTSWTPVISGLDDMNVNSLAVSGATLYAGTGSSCSMPICDPGHGGVFRSTDKGASWTHIGLTYTIVQSVAVSGTSLLASTAGYLGYLNGRIYRSTDGGANWTTADTIPYTSGAFFTVSGTNLFAMGSKIFLSTNDGASWTDISTGSESSFFYGSFAVGSTHLFAGTWGRGVWTRPLSEVTSVKQSSNEIPERFELSQNYPNPFNPATNISFSLPSRSFVSLKVFDLFGREVVTLCSEVLPAGTYTAQWNAQGVSSGTYFYRLQAGSFAQTKKLVLLR